MHCIHKLVLLLTTNAIFSFLFCLTGLFSADHCHIPHGSYAEEPYCQYKIFTDWMPFLSPSQWCWCQSTEGVIHKLVQTWKFFSTLKVCMLTRQREFPYELWCQSAASSVLHYWQSCWSSNNSFGICPQRFEILRCSMWTNADTLTHSHNCKNSDTYFSGQSMRKNCPGFWRNRK